jgi:hypothetical protein
MPDDTRISQERAKLKERQITGEKDAAELEDRGMPLSSASRIAGTDPTTVPNHDYDAFSDQDIADRAQELEIEGRESMLKEDLIEAIRRHEDPQRVDAARQARRGDPNSGVQGTTQTDDPAHSKRDPQNKGES